MSYSSRDASPRFAEEPGPRIAIRFKRTDFWRTAGGLNVTMTLAAIVLIPLAVVFAFAREPIIGIAAVTALCVQVMVNHRVVRSLVAIVSTRPFIRFDHNGIAIDGGPFDCWSLAWHQIEAVAPTMDYFHQHLALGHLSLTFRLSPPPARRFFSDIQHSKLRDHLELSCHCRPLSPFELDTIVHLLNHHIAMHEPCIISDNPA